MGIRLTYIKLITISIAPGRALIISCVCVYMCATLYHPNDIVMKSLLRTVVTACSSPWSYSWAAVIDIYSQAALISQQTTFVAKSHTCIIDVQATHLKEVK